MESSNKGIIGGITVLIVLIVGFVFLASCTVRIPAGYVGVKYNINKGVESNTLSQGWHIVAPNIKVKKYTVGLEQSYLTKGKKGDSPSDESFTASSSEGKSLDIDLTYTYQYQANKVSDVFTKFKGQNGKEIRDVFIKPNIVSWTKEVISRYKVSDILGSERANVNTALTEYLAEKFDTYGITISNVSLINIEVDKKTREAINAKITAQQKAETQKINNQTAIDKAKADAEVRKTDAKAKADAQLIEAQAEAESNKKLSGSITENLIKMKEAEARLEHGWVTIQGSDTVVTKDK